MCWVEARQEGVTTSRVTCRPGGGRKPCEGEDLVLGRSAQFSSFHHEAADPASAPLQAGVTWSLTAPSDAGVVFEAEADVRQQGRGDGRAKVPLVASLLH
jgi:hypothetical protein